MDNIIKSGKKSIFVRSCYAPLYEESIRISNVNDPAVDPISVFILGTPGCGKSLFRMYFCHRLLNMAKTQNKDTYILFQKADTNAPATKSVFVVKKANSDESATMLTYRPESVLQLSIDVNLWQRQGSLVVSLIDVSSGLYQNVSVITRYSFLFSSLNSLLVDVKDRLKSNSVKDVYMWLWLLEECKEANKVLKLGISDVDIEHRFFRFGGSARAVLENPALAQSFLDKALKSISVQSNQPLCNLLTASEDEVASLFSHSLFHITCGDSFTIPKYQWASLRIKHLVAAIALEQMTNELEGIINSPLVASGTKGEMVEALWFERFVLATKSASKGNLMTLKELSIKPISSPSASDLLTCLTSFINIEVRWCSKDLMSNYLQKALEDISQPHFVGVILLRPHEFTMMAIDGIIVFRLGSRVCVIYLQATIRETHPTSEKAAEYLDSLTTICSADIFQALIFILPKHRFESWSRQTVFGNGVSSCLPQYAIVPGVRLSGSVKADRKRPVDADEEQPSSEFKRITRSSAKNM